MMVNDSVKDSQNPQPIDYSRKWLVLVAIGMGVFLATIDSSIVNVALPTFVKEFNVRFAVVQWVVLGYLLTLATLMLGFGRLADMIGKKKIYLTGMIIFTSGSLLCGLSQTVYWLIGFRILQAIGAAMMIALGAGIITESFPSNERGKALGIVGGIVSIGIITGPTLGGILIDFLSWHWIFFVNLPIGFIGSFLVYRFIPKTIQHPNQKFDFLGALALFVSLLTFMLALTLGQRSSFTNTFILVLFSGWFVFLILFVIFELKVSQPMIDLRLFQNLLFSLNLFTGFLSFVSMGGVILLMPFYLENVLGYNPNQVGFLLAVVPVAAGLISPISGSLSDRFGSRSICAIGLFFMIFGFITIFSLDEHTTSIGYILRFLPVGLGIGIFQSPNNSAIMGTAPREKLGIVSSMLSITRTLGQSAGIAALGAFWVRRISVYAHNHFEMGATRTQPQAQVRGLHDTVLVVIFFLAIAFMLNLCALFCQKKKGNLEAVR